MYQNGERTFLRFSIYKEVFLLYDAKENFIEKEIVGGNESFLVLSCGE